MKLITKGENAIIRRNLEKADGSDLMADDLTTISVDIIQNGNTLETLSYPTPKLRKGTVDWQVDLEISTDISNQFTTGKVVARWTLIGSSAIFTAEAIQKVIIIEDILDVK